MDKKTTFYKNLTREGVYDNMAYEFYEVRYWSRLWLKDGTPTMWSKIFYYKDSTKIDRKKEVKVLVKQYEDSTEYKENPFKYQQCSESDVLKWESDKLNDKNNQRKSP